MPDRLTPAERAARASKPSAARERPSRIAGYIAPVASRPPTPRSLGPKGRALWREAWAAGHWLTPLDRLAVRLACDAVDEIEALDLIIEADGRVVSGSKGQPVAHPAIAQRRAVRDDLLHLMGQLGLTAAGRRRLGIETRQAPEPDPLEAFLSGREKGLKP